MRSAVENLDNAPSSSESEILGNAPRFSGGLPVDNLEKLDGFQLSESEEKVGDSPSFSESEENPYILHITFLFSDLAVKGKK